MKPIWNIYLETSDGCTTANVEADSYGDALIAFEEEWEEIPPTYTCLEVVKVTDEHGNRLLNAK